jgi:hypothetical protein
MSATIIRFPGREGRPAVTPSDVEPDDTVLEVVAAAAARLPSDSEWRGWMLRRARDARSCADLAAIREHHDRKGQ